MAGAYEVCLDCLPAQRFERCPIIHILAFLKLVQSRQALGIDVVYLTLDFRRTSFEHAGVAPEVDKSIRRCGALLADKARPAEFRMVAETAF